MKKIRIAHLSDLHLTPSNRFSRLEPKLFGKLRGMNQTFKSLMLSGALSDVDWLFVTGDVTDRGDLDSWHNFWDVVEKAGFSNRCLVVPGNHDACNLGLSLRPIRETEKRGKERLRRLRRGLVLGKQEYRFPWVKTIGQNVAVFGIDSSNLGNLSVLTNAVGSLGFRQLEALARLLKKYKKIPVKIIMLHHSPNIPRQETEVKRGLSPTSKLARWGHEVPREDRRLLRLLAVTQNVQLILHGHLHRAENRRVNGVRIIGVPAATETAADAYKQMQVYDIYLKSKKIFARSKRVSVPSTK